MDSTVVEPSALAHPDPSRLAEFGLGRLGEGESSTIADHVSACDACRAVVETLADDTLAGLLRLGDGTAVGEPSGNGSPSGYEVLEVLGEGGMGVVSKARQVALGRLVALKQLRPELLAGRDGVARFRREAEAAARLRHPNIVPIYDVGWRGDAPYFSMEYVEGGTLARVLAGGPITPGGAARLVETLALAVQHAHDAGVVHRDLKPANILLAPDLDHPKVADFGLAKLDEDSTRTGSGVLLGTPGYMSPEQAEGHSSGVGPATDIHALGAILYEALTGRPPFRAPSVLETLEQVRKLEPTPPRRFRAGIPRDLETIALKCLEKIPARRYASARALADDLRRHLDGESILARSASHPERLARWARRRPWQATSATLGVILLAGSLAGTLAHNARLREEVRRADREAEASRAQRARAEAQYRSARDAIRLMLGRLDEPRFAGRPLGGELGVRRQLLEDALAFFEGAVRDDAPAEPSQRLDKVDALFEVANHQILLGKSEEARRTLGRALALLEALGAEGKGGPEVVRKRVAGLIKLGFALEGSGRLDEALASYGDAIARAERTGPGTLDGGDDLAWGHHVLGSLLLSAGRLAGAESHLARASEIRRALLVSRPGDVLIQFRLAGTLVNLANTHARLRDGRADAEFAEAAALLTPIVRDHPEQQEAILALGKLHLSWGWMALGAKQVDLALGRFRSGLGPVEALLRAVPDWPEVKQEASQIHSAMAIALGDAGRPREAIAAWDRSIALAADAGAIRTYRLGRLASLAHAGEALAALDEAEAMATESLGAIAGLDFYNYACVAAVVAASESCPIADRARAADRSIGWLGRALDLGLFRDGSMVGALDGDPDLEALRSRPDFRLLRLDAAFPADPFLMPGR